MAKKATKKKPAHAAERAEIARVSAQRAELRRLLAAQRNVSELVRKCRRAIERASAELEGFVRSSAREMNLQLHDADIFDQAKEQVAELARTNAELRKELDEARAYSLPATR